MVYNFFDKKSSGGAIKSISHQQPEDELHKPIIRKFKKRRVYSSFKENIWNADLSYMQLISKFNKEMLFIIYYWYF